MIGVVPWLGPVYRKSEKVKNPLDFLSKKRWNVTRKNISYLEINGQYLHKNQEFFEQFSNFTMICMAFRKLIIKLRIFFLKRSIKSPLKTVSYVRDY